MLWLKTLVFIVLVPATVVGYIPYWLLAGDGGLPPVEGFGYLGLPFIAAGIAVVLWCMADFVTAGRGTPAPIDPPTALVERGLYRYMRNPMYVGALTVLAGEALAFRSLTLAVYACLVALAFALFVHLYEEPALRRQFGEAYERYCARVPRWLPRPTRRK